MRNRLARLRRLFIALGVLAGLWSVLLAWTHGVAFTIGPLRVTSHNPRNPAVTSLVLFALALLCAPPGARWRALGQDLLRPLQLALAAARVLGRSTVLLTRAPTSHGAALALVVLTLGLSWTRGTFVVGGSDSYGYVSTARLFVTGRLIEPQPLMRRFEHIPAHAWVPLGYVGDPDRDALVPMYSPGLPLTMALFERVGGANAVYVVMPVLAALAVWATYQLGIALATPAAGLGAALLLLASPAFLFQLLFPPMSDIPATAWWAVVLAIVLRRSRGDQRGAAAASNLHEASSPTARESGLLPTRSGIALAIATAAAILTRPNLVPLAGVIGAFLLWQVRTAGHSTRRGMRPLAWFLAGAVPACLAQAWFNTVWHGSPLRSGYSGMSLFGLSHWRTNLIQFPAWLAESQTPLLLAGLVTPLLLIRLRPRTARPEVAKAWLLAACAGVVFLSYVFYQPFDAWWFLRFLLPAFPALAVLTCVGFAALSDRFGAAARVAAVAVVGLATAYAVSFSRDISSLGEYRYRLMGEYVRDRLPPNALVLSMQHSGSIRFYSGRETLRYDRLEHPDRALHEVQQAGFRPYLAADPWEVENIRKEWKERSERAPLDWPPVAIVALGDVRIWDLSEERSGARRSQRSPEEVPIPAFIRRRLP